MKRYGDSYFNPDEIAAVINDRNGFELVLKGGVRASLSGSVDDFMDAVMPQPMTAIVSAPDAEDDSLLDELTRLSAMLRGLARGYAQSGVEGSMLAHAAVVRAMNQLDNILAKYDKREQ